MCAHKAGVGVERGWGGGGEELSESQLFPQATGQ